MALVLTKDSRALLYIDFKQFKRNGHSTDLDMVWDPTLYGSSSVLELEAIRMEGRADLKIFNRALSRDELASRYAYRNRTSAPSVSHCPLPLWDCFC